MDIKAICNVVFEDKRVERSQTIEGTMTIKLKLELWETAKHELRRFIVTRYVEVTRFKQYALDGMESSKIEIPVYENEELFLCPIDTTPSDAIRIALGMWEDPTPVHVLFDRLLNNGALDSKPQYQVAEA